MYTERYVRALLRRRALELGSSGKLAKQLGLSYANMINELNGKRGISQRSLDLLRLKRFIIFVPTDLPVDEIDTRLAIGRRGTTNGKAARGTAA